MQKKSCYRRQCCLKRFYKDLREHAMKITDYVKKEFILHTYKENKSHENQKICYICKKKDLIW